MTNSMSTGCTRPVLDPFDYNNKSYQTDQITQKQTDLWLHVPLVKWICIYKKKNRITV